MKKVTKISKYLLRIKNQVNFALLYFLKYDIINLNFLYTENFVFTDTLQVCIYCKK